jgi:hypothetical protein
LSYTVVYLSEVAGIMKKFGKNLNQKKAVNLESADEALEIPYRTLIPGTSGGISFKLDLQVKTYLNLQF